MIIKAWGTTDVGKTRDHNEDNYLVDEEIDLYVVADGMGGHAAGEVASSIAAETVRDAVIKNRDLIESYVMGDDAVQKYDIAQILEHAVQAACSDIFQRAQNEPEKKGMGTTLSLLLIAGERGFVAHVGDSRIYLIRQNQVHQITEDHSLINHLIRKGRLKRSEIEDSPYAQYKNAVTRAVGVYESVEVDSLDFDILAGDRFLLCSDGLSAYLEDDNIKGVFESNKPEKVPSAFVQLANNGGGHDNITAVIVHALTDEEGSAARRAVDVRLRMEIMAKMPLFSHLKYKELVRVLNITRVRKYKPKDVIIREGEPGDELLVVLDGKVDLTKDGAYITSFERGAHFGEMALVDKSPRSATAIAHNEARLLVIRQDDFYKVLSKEPELSVKLLWSFVKVLTERLRQTTSQLSGERLMARAEDLSEEVDICEETQEDTQHEDTQHEDTQEEVTTLSDSIAPPEETEETPQTEQNPQTTKVSDAERDLGNNDNNDCSNVDAVEAEAITIDIAEPQVSEDAAPGVVPSTKGNEAESQKAPEREPEKELQKEDTKETPSTTSSKGDDIRKAVPEPDEVKKTDPVQKPETQQKNEPIQKPETQQKTEAAEEIGSGEAIRNIATKPQGLDKNKS